jgi:phosphoesterase RecJ-like protein
MNYEESEKILDEIKKANKILVNCHRGPDSDSVGSALALYEVLSSMGKLVEVASPSDIPSDLTFLRNSHLIKKVNFTSFDIGAYDLFLIVDSSTYGFATGIKGVEKPPINSIVIDHHFSNDKFGDLNLVDASATSTGELLYKIFEDWGVVIGKDAAECLLTGIIGDTGCFQYQNVGKETLEIAAKLIEFGADKDKIIYNIYRNIEFKEVKMWGKFIEKMNLEPEYNFIWSAISYAEYKDFGEYPYAKEDAANLFFPIVKGTDFGVVMVEASPNTLSVSFRSRSGFDVAKIAEEVGGGGHKVASGAVIEGVPFNEAVEKVVSVARKHAKKI